MKNKLLATGICGTVFAVLCCFTPFLAIVLPAIGLGAVLGYIYTDAVLLPMLAFFLAMTVFAVWRRRKAP